MLFDLAKSRFGARTGVTEDGKYTVFSFGVDYLRQQFSHGLNDMPVNVDVRSQQCQRPVYTAVIPTSELESYVREQYHRCSYNFDPNSGNTINPVLKTFNIDRLDKLPARASIDIAMGFSANKFIGKSIAEETTRVDLYADAFGQKANCSSYTADDVVMVTGNRFANKQIGREIMGKFFQSEYLPLLKSARKAGATILLGNGNSIDALAKKYLTDSGYTILDRPEGYCEAVPANRAAERQQQIKKIGQSKVATSVEVEPKTSTRKSKLKAADVIKIPVEIEIEESPSESAIPVATDAPVAVASAEPTEQLSTKRKYLRSLTDDTDLSRIEFETESTTSSASLSV